MEHSGTDRPERDNRGRTARRRVWVPRAKPTRFVASSTVPTIAALASRLTDGTERVYLVGDRPGPGGTADSQTTWATGPLPDGWAVADRGHYLHATRPTFHLVAPDGRRVEIIRAASWLGEGDYSAAEAADALRLARDAIRAQWSEPDWPLLSTASTAGRDLWLRTIPWGVEIPTLPPEIQERIRATGTQGRWQRWAPDDGRDLDGLHGFDMRFGYGALLRGLPDPATARWHEAAGVTQDAWGRGAPWRYVRGRFQVRAQVPDGWGHVGLLGLRDPDHSGPDCGRCTGVDDAGTWCYPDRPGTTFTTWAEGTELALAADHGWRFTVGHAVTFEEGRPLDLWAQRLHAAREAVGSPSVPPEIVRLARSALRMIVLQTVGAMIGRGHTITHVIGSTDQAPDGAAVGLLGDGLVWHEEAAAAWGETAHPEWSAAVWGRCRTRIASHRGRGLLAIPRERLVAVRQDAIYLTGACPDWPDDGKVGTLRQITSVHGPAPWPRSVEDLVASRERSA